MKLSRRDFMKANAVAAAAAVAGVSAPPGGEPDHQYRQDRHHLGQGAVPLLRDRLFRAGGLPGWPRRGDPGDPDAPVNRGLNCIKGYFLSKIMYGRIA